METPVASPLLWARAVLVAAFAFFLGLAGHVIEDGAVAGYGVLTTVFSAMVIGNVPLLARPASARRMLALLVSGQLLLHVCLTLDADHRKGQQLWPSPRTLLAADHPLTDVSAHILAAAFVAFWLAYGERRLFAALRISARVLLRLVRPTAVIALVLVRRRADNPAVAARIVEVLFGRTVSRRGPPPIAA